MDNQAVVQHLRRGKCVRFALTQVDLTEAQQMIDQLEQVVGLPFERREVVDAQGPGVVVWVRGFAPPAIEKQYQGVGNGPQGFAAD